MTSTATTLPIIRRAPKAFVPFARRHNELARAMQPLLALSAGYGITITKSQGNIIIAQRQA